MTEPPAGRDGLLIVTQHDASTPQETRGWRFASIAQELGVGVTVACASVSPDDPLTQDRSLTFDVRSLSTRPLTRPSPLSPIWYIRVYRLMREVRPRVALVRDLRLAAPTTFAARRLGIPSILDIGEHYPGMVKALGRTRPVHWLTHNPALARIVESTSVRSASSVWAVCPENVNRLASSAQHIALVPNYPQRLPRMSTTHVSGTSFRLVYVGLLDGLRGMDAAVLALALLRDQGMIVTLDMWGDGPEKPALQELVSEHSLHDRVVFCGWLPEDDKDETIQTYDAALLLHRSNELTEHTQPNKLFEYMAAGLPLIVSSVHPIARVVSAHNCGIVTDGTPQEVAAAVCTLSTNRSEAQAMGARSRQAVISEYTWSSVVRAVSQGLMRCGLETQSND